MEKVLIFTDLHIVEEGQSIIGLDPGARFAEALTHALHHHSDASHVVLTGDLTHHGRPAQYSRLKKLLESVDIPVTFLLGNHDKREAFKAAFPAAKTDKNGYVQTTIDLDHHRLICLDTLDPETDPHHAGRLCAERLEWLEEQLPRGGPTIVLQHHHPAPVGFDGMDNIALSNGPEELALLARHDVRHLFFGHIHRTISGAFGPISFTSFKSPCHQMPMLLGTSSSASSVDEPGSYGIVLLSEMGVVAHSEDFAIAQAPVQADPSSKS